MVCGSLPRSLKGRTQRKLIDLNWARLFSTQWPRSDPGPNSATLIIGLPENVRRLISVNQSGALTIKAP